MRSLSIPGTSAAFTKYLQYSIESLHVTCVLLSHTVRWWLKNADDGTSVPSGEKCWRKCMFTQLRSEGQSGWTGSGHKEDKHLHPQAKENNTVASDPLFYTSILKTVLNFILARTIVHCTNVTITNVTIIYYGDCCIVETVSFYVWLIIRVHQIFSVLLIIIVMQYQ